MSTEPGMPDPWGTSPKLSFLLDPPVPTRPVQVFMSPAEFAAERMETFPRYGAMDVMNIKRPRFGRGNGD